MKAKISIVVPIYNVEQYLDKCVRSLVNQTYENLEIILVDDGSKDKSGQICDLWKEKDNRIKVIHKKNGGLSDARNAGMRIAQGEYMAFVDSDDWVDERIYEILMENMDKYNADISVCSIKKVYEKDILDKVEILNNNISVFTAEEALKNLIKESVLKQTVWNKLYKREVTDNIYFEFGKIHEDEFWTYQIFGRCSSIVYTDEQLYYYLQRPGSIMNKSFSVKRLDALEAKNNRLNYVIKNYPKLELEAKKSLFFSCLYQYQSMIQIRKFDKKDVYIKMIKKYIECINFNKQEKRKLSFKDKIWIGLANISLNLTCKIRNLMKIGI